MNLLEFVKALHDEALELARHAKFNKSFRADGVVVCLYATLIEHTGSMLALSERRLRTGMSSVFRSFLEAYVDFTNLNHDASYAKHINAKHHKEWVKVLRASKKPNPYLKSIGEFEGRDETLRQDEADLAQLQKEGFAPLSAYDRFCKAKMEDAYHSLYNFESSQVHNDLRALINRHVARKGDDDYEIVLYRDTELKDFVTHLDSIAGLLLDATRQLHNRLKSDCDEQINKLDQQLANVRSQNSK